MKKAFKIALAMILAIAFIFAGCSSNKDDSNQILALPYSLEKRIGQTTPLRLRQQSLMAKRAFSFQLFQLIATLTIGTLVDMATLFLAYNNSIMATNPVSLKEQLRTSLLKLTRPTS